MSSVKINDIEYAECNYPNYFWFWTWPIHWMRDVDSVNSESPYFYSSGAGRIENFDVCKWEQFLRCPCGCGYTPAGRVAERTGKAREGSAKIGANRWLCNSCGRDANTLIIWIGRRDSNRWKWKPESELPMDLRPTRTPPPKQKEEKNPEEEFEKRVKAAVEVEIALRAQVPKSEIILG